MGIVDRVFITWLCLFLTFGAVVTYRHHWAERGAIAAQADMANARASLPKFDDTPADKRR